MGKLRLIPTAYIIAMLAQTPEQAHLQDEDHWGDLEKDEALVLLGLRAGDLESLAIFLSEGMTVTPLIKEALVQMIEGKGIHSEYQLTVKKNPEYAKNANTHSKHFLNQIARLRVGFAIEVFGGFEKSMHESAVRQACDKFEISRSAAEKIWREYRECDEAKRNRLRPAWGHLCEKYDEISIVSFLGGKK